MYQPNIDTHVPINPLRVRTNHRAGRTFAQRNIIFGQFSNAPLRTMVVFLPSKEGATIFSTRQPHDIADDISLHH